MQFESLGTYSYKEILNTRMSSFSSPYRSAYKPYNSPYYLHCECRTIAVQSCTEHSLFFSLCSLTLHSLGKYDLLTVFIKAIVRTSVALTHESERFNIHQVALNCMLVHDKHMVYSLLNCGTRPPPFKSWPKLWSVPTVGYKQHTQYDRKNIFHCEDEPVLKAELWIGMIDHTRSMWLRLVRTCNNDSTDWKASLLLIYGACQNPLSSCFFSWLTRSITVDYLCIG